MGSTSFYVMGFHHVLFHTQNGKKITRAKTKPLISHSPGAAQPGLLKLDIYIPAIHTYFAFYSLWLQKTPWKHYKSASSVKTRVWDPFIDTLWLSSPGLESICWSITGILPKLPDHLVLTAISHPGPFLVLLFCVTPNSETSNSSPLGPDEFQTTQSGTWDPLTCHPHPCFQFSPFLFYFYFLPGFLDPPVCSLSASHLSRAEAP